MSTSKPNCGNSDICDFLRSQPIPEWIKNEKTNAPDKRCEKTMVKPPENTMCKNNNHQNKTVKKRPDNYLCDVHMLSKQQQTNEPPGDHYVQNECFNNDSRSRQHFSSHSFNNNRNSNDDNCTQKCQFKSVCVCTKPMEDRQEPCGFNKSNVQKSTRNNDCTLQKCKKNEDSTLENACVKKHFKPAAISRQCLCKCHYD